MTHHIVNPALRQRPLPSAGLFLRPESPPNTPQPPTQAAALYIHIPFCFHKCHYCDFYSIVDRHDRQSVFLDRLTRELEAVAPLATRPLTSIFVGGGTPTLLRTDLWQSLLTTIHRLFDLSAPAPAGLEFTVECNPETASPELFSVLAAGGVNRLSFGAQSFNTKHLKTLERWHDPESVGRAVELAKQAGIDRRSIDLIFSVPGQTLDEWASDLNIAMSMPIEHMSCYALTYEPRTAMTARLKRGDFQATPDDLVADMYEYTVATLAAKGLHRYEVSNFAIPGAESAHNLVYWRNQSWLAVGPSAAGHLAGHRWKNIARLESYLDFDDAGFSAVQDHEPPDLKRDTADRIMMGIRIAEGLDTTDLLDRAKAVAGDDAIARLTTAANFAVDQGWLDTSAGRWRLTDAGFLFADRVASDLMAALG